MATIDPFTGLSSSNTQDPITGRVTSNPITPPTTPTPVETSAPKVTPVVSASTANDHINNVVVPTMKKAQQSLADYQTQKNTTTINKTNNADGTADLFMSDGSRVKTDINGNIISPTSPEQSIIDTADPGYKFAYSSDGTRTQIPISDTAEKYGMSDSNPTVAPVKPVLASSELPSGITFKQYQDGTYGRYDSNGKYQGTASAQDFTNAQNGQTILDNLNKAASGNYPLSPNQQAQIDSLKSLYGDLINKQTVANANYTGGTTIAQNLYGIGNTMMGMGAIKGVVDDGIRKINSLQSEMAGAVAKMTSAFDSDNLSALKDAYNAFSNSAKELQDNIDKMHADARQARVDAQNQEHQNFQDVLANREFTFNQKKEAFNEYIQKADLTEKQKTDAKDMWYKQQDIALKKTAAALQDFSDNQAAVDSWVTNIKNGDAKLSDVPKNLKDSVSIGMTKGGVSQASKDIINQTVDAIETLKKTPGMSAAIGSNVPSPFSIVTDPMDTFGFKGLPGAKSSGYLAQLERVKQILTLPNLKMLKGVGRITQYEFQALQSSLTSLDKNMDESTYNTELSRVSDVFHQVQNRNDLQDIKSFHDSSSQNADAINALGAKFPNATPAQVKQALGIQ